MDEMAGAPPDGWYPNEKKTVWTLWLDGRPRRTVMRRKDARRNCGPDNYDTAEEAMAVELALYRMEAR